MHARQSSIPLEMKQGPVETRGIDWGGTTVRVVTLPPGVDFTPMFKGLPGDLCQCPHWGYVQSGEIHVRYADGTGEVTRAGELYYWPGGHTGWSGREGVVFIEFSPTDEITPVLTHLAAAMSSSR
jgi:hypothetical protein